MASENKIILTHWAGGFLLGNVILFWFLGLNYLPSIPWIETPFITPHLHKVLHYFVLFAYLGQLGLFALFSCAIPILLARIFPRPNWIIGSAVVIATLIATLLVIDTLAYKIYHFHFNGMLLNFVFSGHSKEIFGLTWKEYALAMLVVSALLAIEFFYAIWLWRFVSRKKILCQIKWILAIVGFCLYLSYSMILYSSHFILNRAMVDIVHFLPFYTEILGAILPTKDGLKIIESQGESSLIQPKKINMPLNYPLQPMQFGTISQPMNIVMIVIDTWRFDMLNQEVTPNIHQFAKKSLVFTQHYSGGNSTGPGIFSLFYGLPVSYWTAMEEQKRGPVLVDELLKQHYQMGVFASATLLYPAFNKTVFSAIQNLKTETEGWTPYDRDRTITKEFKEFVASATQQKKPFFSFIFYDSSHSYCVINESLQPRFPVIKECDRFRLTNSSNPIPYFNRYKNAVSLVDQEIGQVLSELTRKNLLKNTIVIITGDHGEEFNDNHLNYWGHASNFTHYQVQTPLIVYWPGMKPRIYSHQTSHFDIAPTLLKKLFACQTPAEKFSLGTDLFDLKQRSYLLAGSYVALGVIQANEIMEIAPSGNVRVERLNGEPAPDIKIDISAMRQAFQDSRRFFKV